MLQNATPLRKSAPWPPNMYCACHAKCIFPDPLQLSHACHRFWTCYKLLIAPTAQNYIRTFKMVWGVFNILTWKCASRHNGVHFFDISTSKSGLRPSVFNTFDFEMCFAPQLNFQECSDVGLLCTFWLRNVLRATRACNFSSLIWPDGSAPAALASLLFDLPEPQIIGKRQWITTFLPFRAPASSFFWLFLFSDLLSSSLLFLFLFLFLSSPLLCSSLLFSSLTLPTSACPSVHIGGSLTSKLLMKSYTSKTCFLT